MFIRHGGACRFMATSTGAILIALATLIVGCSRGKLSRSEALHVLKNHVSADGTSDANLIANINGPEPLMIETGKQTRTSPGQYCKGDIYLPLKVSEVRDKGYDRDGILVLRELAPCGDWNISVSPMSQHDIISNSGPMAELRLASAPKQMTIEGIVQDGPHAMVQVEMHSQYTSTGLVLAKRGEFSGAVSFVPETGEATYVDQCSRTKYDDGWRLDKCVESTSPLPTH